MLNKADNNHYNYNSSNVFLECIWKYFLLKWLCTIIKGISDLKENITKKSLNVSNTRYLVHKNYSSNLVYFFWPSKLAFIATPNFPCVPIFLRCARHFGLMTCNGCSVLFFFFFFFFWGGGWALSWAFPRKISHCITFECSNRAKTKQDPKLCFFSFPNDNS